MMTDLTCKNCRWFRVLPQQPQANAQAPGSNAQVPIVGQPKLGLCVGWGPQVVLASMTPEGQAISSMAVYPLVSEVFIGCAKHEETAPVGRVQKGGMT